MHSVRLQGLSFEAVSSEVENTKREMSAVREEQKRLLHELQRLNQSHREAESNLNIKERVRSDTLRKHQSHAFERQVAALRRLERHPENDSVQRGLQLLRREGVFKRRVFGPLGIVVKVRSDCPFTATERRRVCTEDLQCVKTVSDRQVKEEAALSVAEHFLAGRLLGFLCLDYDNDFRVLSDANLQCYCLLPGEHPPPRPTVTAAMRSAGVLGFLTDFLEIPEEALATFCEYTKAHLCAVCRDGLSSFEEEQLTRVLRDELVAQGVKGAAFELVYYADGKASRVKTSAYSKSAVHSATLVRRRPVVLQLSRAGGEASELALPSSLREEQLASDREALRRLSEERLAVQRRREEVDRRVEFLNAQREILQERLRRVEQKRDRRRRLELRLQDASTTAAAERRKVLEMAAALREKTSLSSVVEASKKERLQGLHKQLQCLRQSSAALREALEQEAALNEVAERMRKTERQLGASRQRLQTAEEEVGSRVEFGESAGVFSQAGSSGMLYFSLSVSAARRPRRWSSRCRR